MEISPAVTADTLQEDGPGVQPLVELIVPSLSKGASETSAWMVLQIICFLSQQILILEDPGKQLL